MATVIADALPGHARRGRAGSILLMAVGIDGISVLIIATSVPVIPLRPTRPNPFRGSQPESKL